MNKRTPPDTGHEEPTSADGRGVPPGSVERVYSKVLYSALYIFLYKNAL
jgi:hypothetical protein